MPASCRSTATRSKTVPSTISLMGTIKSMRSDDVDVDALAPWVSIGYGSMLDDTIDARAAGELPDAQFVDVRYADLMSEPVATIASVYERLGVEPPAGHDTTVRDHLAVRPKGARGVHRYSLDDTGLDPGGRAGTLPPVPGPVRRPRRGLTGSDQASGVRSRR